MFYAFVLNMCGNFHPSQVTRITAMVSHQSPPYSGLVLVSLLAFVVGQAAGQRLWVNSNFGPQEQQETRLLRPLGTPNFDTFGSHMPGTAVQTQQEQRFQQQNSPPLNNNQFVPVNVQSSFRRPQESQIRFTNKGRVLSPRLIPSSSDMTSTFQSSQQQGEGRFPGRAQINPQQRIVFSPQMSSLRAFAPQPTIQNGAQPRAQLMPQDGFRGTGSVTGLNSMGRTDAVLVPARRDGNTARRVMGLNSGFRIITQRELQQILSEQKQKQMFPGQGNLGQTSAPGPPTATEQNRSLPLLSESSISQLLDNSRLLLQQQQQQIANQQLQIELLRQQQAFTQQQMHHVATSGLDRRLSSVTSVDKTQSAVNRLDMSSLTQPMLSSVPFVPASVTSTPVQYLLSTSAGSAKTAFAQLENLNRIQQDPRPLQSVLTSAPATILTNDISLKTSNNIANKSIQTVSTIRPQVPDSLVPESNMVLKPGTPDIRQMTTKSTPSLIPSLTRSDLNPATVDLKLVPVASAPNVSVNSAKPSILNAFSMPNSEMGMGVSTASTYQDGISTVNPELLTSQTVTLSSKVTAARLEPLIINSQQHVSTVIPTLDSASRRPSLPDVFHANFQGLSSVTSSNQSSPVADGNHALFPLNPNESFLMHAKSPTADNIIVVNSGLSLLSGNKFLERFVDGNDTSFNLSVILKSKSPSSVDTNPAKERSVYSELIQQIDQSPSPRKYMTSTRLPFDALSEGQTHSVRTLGVNASEDHMLPGTITSISASLDNTAPDVSFVSSVDLQPEVIANKSDGVSSTTALPPLYHSSTTALPFNVSSEHISRHPIPGTDPSGVGQANVTDSLQGGIETGLTAGGEVRPAPQIFESWWAVSQNDSIDNVTAGNTQNVSALGSVTENYFVLSHLMKPSITGSENSAFPGLVSTNQLAASVGTEAIINSLNSNSGVHVQAQPSRTLVPEAATSSMVNDTSASNAVSAYASAGTASLTSVPRFDQPTLGAALVNLDLASPAVVESTTSRSLLADSLANLFRQHPEIERLLQAIIPLYQNKSSVISNTQSEASYAAKVTEYFANSLVPITPSAATNANSFVPATQSVATITNSVVPTTPPVHTITNSLVPTTPPVHTITNSLVPTTPSVGTSQSTSTSNALVLTSKWASQNSPPFKTDSSSSAFQNPLALADYVSNSMAGPAENMPFPTDLLEITNQTVANYSVPIQPTLNSSTFNLMPGMNDTYFNRLLFSFYKYIMEQSRQTSRSVQPSVPDSLYSSILAFVQKETATFNGLSTAISQQSPNTTRIANTSQATLDQTAEQRTPSLPGSLHMFRQFFHPSSVQLSGHTGLNVSDSHANTVTAAGITPSTTPSPNSPTFTHSSIITSTPLLPSVTKEAYLAMEELYYTLKFLKASSKTTVLSQIQYLLQTLPLKTKPDLASFQHLPAGQLQALGIPVSTSLETSAVSSSINVLAHVYNLTVDKVLQLLSGKHPDQISNVSQAGAAEPAGLEPTFVPTGNNSTNNTTTDFASSTANVISSTLTHVAEPLEPTEAPEPGDPGFLEHHFKVGSNLTQEHLLMLKEMMAV